MTDEYLVTNLARAVSHGRTPQQAADEMVQGGFDDDTAQRILKLYLEKVAKVSTLKEPDAMVGEDHRDWYAGPVATDPCWPRLKAWLSETKGWPTDVLSSLDDASTRIVSLLHPPYAERFSTRGLVLGYVQSGKTANFTAVISKAVDVGYKFVIVLSGLHNGLRQQTQERLETELVDLNPRLWFPLTSVDQDFRPSVYNATAFFAEHTNQKVLCVVKKNGPRLRALLKWLRRADKGVISSCPMLMIDDEADQASVDTKGTDDPSMINKLIRDILKVFKRGAYVAYTATPFANIVSDPSQADLLYPRDFIVDLPRPAAYFGAERMFGTEPWDQDEDDPGDGPPMIRLVPKEDVAQVKPPGRDGRGSFEPELPPSLWTALRWFWLSCAVRLARGQGGAHMSMLVHTTLFNDVHQRFEHLFHDANRSADAAWRNDDPALKSTLQALFDEEVGRIPPESCGEVPVDFDAAWDQLGAVFRKLKVVIDNSKSQNRLVYGDGGSMQIVVGGNTLSRGLTLEGLCVSYFVRTSTMYDTLLQMGRWFGYRKGYADLPRIWMTPELLDYFQHLARVEAEIRQDIARYEAEGLTPTSFAPRIQCHSTLAVTSPLKLRYAATSEMTFDGQTKQTTYFHHHDEAWLRQNLDASQALLTAADAIRSPERIWGRHLLWRGVGAAQVLRFLERYRVCERHTDMSSELLSRYIQAQNSEDELLTWNVGVISRGEEKSGKLEGLLPHGEAINLLSRARFGTTEPANLKAIMSQTDRALDMGLPSAPTSEQIKADGAKTPAAWCAARRGKSGLATDPATGQNTPLLLLYPIAKDSTPVKPSPDRFTLDAVDHIVGLALVFPGAKRLTPQGYITADLSRIEEGAEEMEYAEEPEVES